MSGTDVLESAATAIVQMLHDDFEKTVIPRICV